MSKISTREALLNAGYDLIHQKGYHATGIQEITDAVNVSKGSFYNHFKKKEKFTLEIIEELGEKFRDEHIKALKDGKLSAFERIQQFYMKKTDAVINVMHFQKGCFLSNICQEEADKSLILADGIDKAFSGMAAAIKDCLDEAVFDGSIAPDTNTDLVAEFILNAWNGALMRVKASKNEKALSAFMLYIKSLRI